MNALQELTLRQIMNRIYKDLEGFEIPHEDELAVKKSKGSPVYGEINQQALNILLSYLKLGPEDIFYDLGSGVGKVITQTVLSTPVGQAFGIELSSARFEEALLALKRTQEYVPDIQKRLKFINEDLLTTDLSKATVIYTCSTAFSQAFMNKLTKRLLEFRQPFRLVSLQELPEIGKFKLLKILKLDMSWTRKSPVHIYERSPCF
jgi:hypothetical protein